MEPLAANIVPWKDNINYSFDDIVLIDIRRVAHVCLSKMSVHSNRA